MNKEEIHNKELGEIHNKKKDKVRQNNHLNRLPNDGVVDGFDISNAPDYKDAMMPNIQGFNASKLLQIGDISIPELRKRLFKRRQEILKKNKYYVQQKVISQFI